MSCGLYDSAEMPPGSYTGTLLQSRVVQSRCTENIGVTLYWQLHSVYGSSVRVWKTLWLSPAAMARSKQELARLGVRTLADLDNDPPVQPGVNCRLVIAESRSWDGCVELRIKCWEVVS